MGSETTEEYGDPQDFTYEESLVNPTPTADGEVERIVLDYVQRARGDNPDNLTSYERTAFAAMERLCARPALPADVQAVVERVKAYLDAGGYPDNVLVDVETAWADSPTYGDLRTLLAYLTRQET